MPTIPVMIDLHCHILPGVDDGPQSFEEAVAMAKIAVEDGVTIVAATPHILPNSYQATELADILTQLNNRLLDLNIPLKLFMGAEVSFQMPPSMLKGYTINNTSYVLIEFPHSHLPADAGQIIFNLQVNGFLPIIAHPERNPSVIKDPSSILNLLGEGVYLQLTAASVAGKFGKSVQKCAVKLLESGCVHLLGTDAHSPIGRRPILSQGLKAASKVIGAEKALKLVTVNPEAVIAGKPISC